MDSDGRGDGEDYGRSWSTRGAETRIRIYCMKQINFQLKKNKGKETKKLREPCSNQSMNAGSSLS